MAWTSFPWKIIFSTMALRVCDGVFTKRNKGDRVLDRLVENPMAIMFDRTVVLSSQKELRLIE